MPIINQVVSEAAFPNIPLAESGGTLTFGVPIDLTGLTDIRGTVFYSGTDNVSNFTNATGEPFKNAESLTQVSTPSAFKYTFYNCTSVTGVVSLPNLATVSGIDAFRDAFYNTGITRVSLPNLTTVSWDRALYETFTNCTGITGVSLSNLTTVSGNNALYYTFYNCTGITGMVSLSNLTTVSGDFALYDAFANCTGITGASLPNLTTVSGTSAFRYAFNGCTELASVDLPNLTTVTDGAFMYIFSGCTKLKSIYLPKITSNTYVSRPSNQDFSNAFSESGVEIVDLRNLQTVGDYGLFDNMLGKMSYINTINVNALTHIGTEGARAFLTATTATIKNSLKDLYFPMLTTFGTNPFYGNAFNAREDLTIHFRKDVQATVEALNGYATLFGASTGSSIVFDLAGTLTGADSNAYARSEIDSVYASETAGAAKTATAWKYNNTVYYTVGDTEPSIGDTIYSDDACTQSVTTITAIA